jgi:hypothetical protein
MKKILYTIVIIVALGGALVMGYLAFFGDDTSVATDPTLSQSGAPVYNILPHGRSFDFNTVKNFNRDGRLFPYPEVTPAEIGVTLNNLME